MSNTGAVPVRRMRQRNLERILHAVARSGEVRQSDLPGLTDLATGAVSSMVNELIELELIQGSLIAGQLRGRPARMVRLVDRWVEVVAVGVSRRSAELRGYSLAGRMIERTSIDITSGATEIGDVALLTRDAIARLLREHGRPGARVDVGVAIPGRTRRGRVDSLELKWDDELLECFTRPIEEIPGLSVHVRNDGSLAALAESEARRCGDQGSLVTVHLDYGLGGSALVNGSFVDGYGSGSGWGHVPLDPTGELCRCGLRGCAELHLSLRAFAQELGELRELDNLPSEEYVAGLADRAERGDDSVLEVLAEAKTHFRALADALGAIFDPQWIVLTGRGAELGQWLLPAAAGPTLTPVIAPALGTESHIVGGMLAARSARFADAR